MHGKKDADGTAGETKYKERKMLTAILIITIFNTGLLLLNIGALAVLVDEHRKGVEAIKKEVAEDIETATTAIFNMDSIKQKAGMNGRFEL